MNFQRRVARGEKSMSVKLHTRNFTSNRGIFGMYASLKPLPKPPEILNASRDLRFSWQMKTFQVAYHHGTSFYPHRNLGDQTFGKIVTRLLSLVLPSRLVQVFDPLKGTFMSRTGMWSLLVSY